MENEAQIKDEVGSVEGGSVGGLSSVIHYGYRAHQRKIS